MRDLRWSHGKNQQLWAERGVCFEDVVVAIESGELLDLLDHPNPERYPQQLLLVVRIRGYVYLVPVVEAEDHLFLKTIIPSRKAQRLYSQGETP